MFIRVDIYIHLYIYVCIYVRICIYVLCFFLCVCTVCDISCKNQIFLKSPEQFWK